MKLCRNCGQSVAEEIQTCPSCGSDIGEGRKYIDDYRIEEVLHEGHASILCRAMKDGEDKPVMIRLFVPGSGVDEKVAERLKRELEELKKLPSEGFVSHREIRRSADGLWYRVSEWVDAESWGDLLRSGALDDYRVAFALFSKIASYMAILHETGHFIPHLILSDIMVIKGDGDTFEVLIDYKLSRFLDPKLDQPSPMLKHLMDCHPDIKNQRPLDFRTDIWSLGKIFVEALTADYETCDHLARVDELFLPQKVDVLFKTMLAEDQDLRPRSMNEVAETLGEVTGEEIERARKKRTETMVTSAAAIKRIRRRQAMLAALMVLVILVLGAAWYHLDFKKRRNEAVFEDYANRYARSVAFVVVEYWLRDGEEIVYRNRTEGTAFLADTEGYLVTNRHVACPWLMDSTLFAVAQQLKQNDRAPEFGHRMLLWFEGQKAFSRSAGVLGSGELGDVYLLGSAFRSDGPPRVIIAGVAKPPTQTLRLVTSPLRDDFAVLKIDRVPEGLKALPLDQKMEPQKITKLSEVFSLGFPLGSRTQTTTVNVGVTRGHVRRSFDEFLQIDAPIYGGDSGGPLIDTRGKVIGVVSGVALERAPGLLPMVTPLWNLAMVLPITKVVAFLQELKAGRIKWNGALDLSLDAKLQRITRAAVEGRWAEAMKLADKELELSYEPSLVMAGGMMHLCAGEYRGARRLFNQSLFMDKENRLAMLMLGILDRLSKGQAKDFYHEELISLDWRSPAEFFGYLMRVLDGLVPEDSAIEWWETEAEKSWLQYVVALIREKEGRLEESERMLREGVLVAESNAWEYFLNRAKLDEVQAARLDLLQNEPGWPEYKAEIEALRELTQKNQAAKEGRRLKLATLRTQLKDPSTGPRERLQVLENIFESAPNDGDALVGLAYYSAMEEACEKAFGYTQSFLKKKGRESDRRLSTGLFQAELLRYMGREKEALSSLEEYARLTRDPWYRAIGECLLGKRTLESIRDQTRTSPENLLTLYTALGFWEEGAGEKERAVEHYKEALESLLDTWIEFEFAKQRVKALRRSLKS